MKLIAFTLAPDIEISSALLSRARSLAVEHSTLSSRLADSFDAKVAKRAGELALVTETLKKWDSANEVRDHDCGLK